MNAVLLQVATDVTGGYVAQGYDHPAAWYGMVLFFAIIGAAFLWECYKDWKEKRRG